MSSREDKVYALFVELEEMTFLSVQIAESLEEAFTLAKIEMVDAAKLLGDGKRLRGLSGAKIGLFTIRKVDEMIENTKEFRAAHDEMVSAPIDKNNDGVDVPVTKITIPMSSIPKFKKGKDKNALMKEIIESGDVLLYKRNRSKFTKDEQAYIRAQLKK